jgi:hypothetical protein
MDYLLSCILIVAQYISVFHDNNLYNDDVSLIIFSLYDNSFMKQPHPTLYVSYQKFHDVTYSFCFKI